MILIIIQRFSEFLFSLRRRLHLGPRILLCAKLCCAMAVSNSVTAEELSIDDVRRDKTEAIETLGKARLPQDLVPAKGGTASRLLKFGV